VTWSLAGRSVLITGAARGIGAESARQLASRGAWFEADVTDPDALAVAVDGTVERLGGIDAVVANAGIATTGTVRAAKRR